MKARLKVKAKLFVLCFAIENKKYTGKKIVRVYLYYHTIFDKNSVTLTIVGYSNSILNMYHNFFRGFE